VPPSLKTLFHKLPEFTVTSPLSYVLLFGCIAGVILCIAEPSVKLGFYWEQFLQKRKVTHKKRRRIDWAYVCAGGVILFGICILAIVVTVYIGCDFGLLEYEKMGLCRK
jgi:hypothetical protein